MVHPPEAKVNFRSGSLMISPDFDSQLLVVATLSSNFAMMTPCK